MDNAALVTAILIGNTLVALLVMAIALLLKKGSLAFMLFAVIALLPVAGAVFLLGSAVHHRLTLLKNKELTYEDISFDTTRKTKKIKADIAGELGSLLPLEESFSVSGTKERREAFLHTLKQDYSNNIASLKQGLDNEDSETSHYAASAVMTLVTDFLNKLAVQKHLFDNRSADDGAERAQDYLNILSSFFYSDLMGASDRKKYTDIYVNVLEWLFGEHPGAVAIDDLVLAINLLIEKSAFAAAAVWSQRVIKAFPDEDAAYNVTLKLYYASGDHERFLSLLREIMASDITISNDTLQHIRFFTYRA